MDQSSSKKSMVVTKSDQKTFKTPEKKRKSRDVQPAPHTPPLKKYKVHEDTPPSKSPSPKQTVTPRKGKVTTASPVTKRDAVKLQGKNSNLVHTITKNTPKTQRASLVSGDTPSFKTTNKTIPKKKPLNPRTNNPLKKDSQPPQSSKKNLKNDDNNGKELKSLEDFFGEIPSQSIITEDFMNKMEDYFLHTKTLTFKPLIRKTTENDNELFKNMIKHCKLVEKFQDFIENLKDEKTKNHKLTGFAKKLFSVETTKTILASKETYNEAIRVHYRELLCNVENHHSYLKKNIMAEVFVPAFRNSCAETFQNILFVTNKLYDSSKNQKDYNLIFREELNKDQCWKESLKENLKTCIDEKFELFVSRCLIDEAKFRQQVENLMKK